MLDSVIRVGKKYYLQILLKECKYEISKTKMENHTDDDLESSSSDNESESDNDFDNESDIGSDSECNY